MKSLFISGALFGGFWNVAGHSWAACSDYDAEITGQDYVDSSCLGYPRSWADYNSNSFGDDRGVDYLPGGVTATTWCPKTIGDPDSDYSSTYTDAYPLAQYTVGSTVRIVWPAKNHANYECFSNIPDFAMKILMNPQVNPTSDPTALSDWETVIDWHDEAGKTGSTAVDGVPFTNCPKFCDNTDRAVCYGDLTLDASLFSQSGYYTFMWYWAFNGDDNIYTTCWEAYVDTNGVTVTDSDTDTNSDTDEDTASEASSNNDIEYLVQIPICYTGANYDESTVLEGASNLYSGLDWSVPSVTEGTSEFNATLQTHTTYGPANITESADNDDHEFCNELMTLFGDDGSHECWSCSDVLVYSTGEYSSSSSSDDNSSGSAVIAVIIVLIIVILIIGAGITYQKLSERKNNPNATSGQSAEQGMSAHMQTNSTQAVATAPSR